MRKVLIANRGEIAVRIARSCRDAGLTVCASADRDAVHVQAADEAVPLNGTTPAETYLDMGKVLRAAADCGADALHPGYGFLAESAEFARATLDAGLTWIGPPPAAIRRLGDKLAARQLAGQAGAPLLPGMAVPASDPAQVAAFAREHGLPVAIKAEVQCLADSQGGVAVISTRDCSLQRRHQKIVEEAPAPFLPAGLDERLRVVSAAILRAAGCTGAATCEFLLPRTAPSCSLRRTRGSRSPTRSARR